MNKNAKANQDLIDKSKALKTEIARTNSVFDRLSQRLTEFLSKKK